MAKPMWSFPFAAALALPVVAQEAAQTVTVTGRAPPIASVSGFDDTPLSRAPFSATVLDASTLTNAGIYNLADAARVTSGLSDAYNANGYWSNFTVRGFVLDPRNNVRRDGLPVNAETSLWLGNKQGIEVLRGISGLQARTAVRRSRPSLAARMASRRTSATSPAPTGASAGASAPSTPTSTRC